MTPNIEASVNNVLRNWKRKTEICYGYIDSFEKKFCRLCFYLEGYRMRHFHVFTRKKYLCFSILFLYDFLLLSLSQLSQKQIEQD